MAISTFSSLGAPITNAATGKPGKMAYRMAWIEYSEPEFVAKKTAKIVPNRNGFTSASFEWGASEKYSTAGQCEQRRQSLRLNENLRTRKVENPGLQRLAGGADEIAQNGNVGAINADASGVHRQAEAFGQIQIHAGVVQFRQAETLRWQYAIQTRRVDRPRRPVTLPRAARQFVKLLPIAFVPSRHAIPQYVSLNLLDARPAQKVHRVFRRALLLRKSAPPISAIFIYFTIQAARNFPCLLFQTRYGANCFARQASEGEAAERPLHLAFRSANKPRGYYTRLQGLARIKSSRWHIHRAVVALQPDWTSQRHKGEMLSVSSWTQSSAMNLLRGVRRPGSAGALRAQIRKVCLPTVAAVATISAAPATTAAASTATAP